MSGACAAAIDVAKSKAKPPAPNILRDIIVMFILQIIQTAAETVADVI
jgi:hypothetical protein